MLHTHNDDAEPNSQDQFLPSLMSTASIAGIEGIPPFFSTHIEAAADPAARVSIYPASCSPLLMYKLKRQYNASDAAFLS